MLQWINKNGKQENSALIAKAILALFFLSTLLLAAPASAADTTTFRSQADPNSEIQQGLQTIQQPLGLPATDIRLIIANIIRIALALLGVILLGLILYGGFLWMTAGGNDEQIGKAKKVLVNAVIGLIIILSAYSIVWFIMRMLGVEGGAGGLGAGIAPPGTQNFQGSGALGRAVKDHYPARNQTDVPRNTKISITFFRPIVMSDLSVEKTNDNIAGNCVVPVSGQLNWETNCDALNPSAIQIYRITEEPAAPGATTTREVATPISGAAIMASYVSTEEEVYQGRQIAYTIVIRPYEYLGSETENVKYRVHLSDKIKWDDPVNPGKSAFTAQTTGSTFYEWTFVCGTDLDLSPPHVVNVFPPASATEVKNTVIQITFDEPIDPIGVQGGFESSGNGSFYVLQNNGYVFLKNNNSAMPQGRFEILNNYRTLEFSSSIPCGKNACGGTVYCLPVCDKPGAKCAQDDYQVLLRAALTANKVSFEAVPFSGISDMAGNALDGNDDLKVQNASREEGDVFVNQKEPDNRWWAFTLENKLDLTPPHIVQVTPGPDAGQVASDQDWTMLFSKRMRVGTLYSISIDEAPTPAERCGILKISNCVLDPIWKVPRIWFETTPIGGEFTRTVMEHGPFLDGLSQFYLPFISSAVEDAHYNCLYPGQGPEEGDGAGQRTDQVTKQSSVCLNGVDCCLKSGLPDDFCCNGQAGGSFDPQASAACSASLKVGAGK